jgi:hypothetical protein
VIWDVSNGNDRLHASPPDSVLLALAPGGSRIIVAGADNSAVWDTELDLARAVLPVRADAAAIPGRGEAIFVVPGDVGASARWRVLALPEDPAALGATIFPGAADSVQTLRLANGVAEFLEVADVNSKPNHSAQRSGADGSTIRVHRLDTGTGTWTIAAAIDRATAFELAPDRHTFAAAAGGQVLVVSNEPDKPAQRLAPPVAADRLAFSADGTYLLVFASTDGGGQLHLWHRASGEHWSVPIGGRPSAMAVTRDGRYVLAITESAAATRAGASFKLTRWRVTEPDNNAALELGRGLSPPLSVCAVLGKSEKPAKDANSDGIGVTAAEIAECSDAKPAPPAWHIEAGGTQATVYAPSGAAVARIDQAAKILQAALSPDAREALTLDESGHVQRFAIEPKDLIAQACRRHPQALSGDLRASLPDQVRTIDACGRKSAVEATAEAKR